MTPKDRGSGELVQLLKAASFVSRVVFDAPIGVLTTYRVGGCATALIEVHNPDELVELGRIAASAATPVLVVGGGSNLLVADSGFDGVALTLGSSFSRSEVSGTIVTAGAAVKLPVLARATVAAELTGFEWAVGVPGTVGGAVRMNAGGHGAEIRDSLKSADVVDLASGARVQLGIRDLDFGYRSSSITESQVVVSAEFHLDRGIPRDGERLMSEIVQWRRANQPGGQNAGSVFTNPPGLSAGRLIEEAGAKGLRLGSAQVSTKHANFIQADENGSADDIHNLMREVMSMVLQTHGIELRVETKTVGFSDPVGSRG